MARDTKAIYIDLSGQHPELQSDDPSPRERDTEDTLQAFLDEFGPQSSKLSLYRLKPGTAKFEWLNHYVPDAVTPETIRDEFGAGTYALNLLDERGHYITRRTFDIGGSAEDWERARITGGRAAAAAAAPAESSNSNELTLELIRAQGQMLLALATRQQPNGLEDAVKVLNALGERTGPKDQLETLGAMVKLARDIGGGGDSMVSLLREVAPAVLGPLGQLVTSRAGASGGQLPKPTPAALPAPREVTTPDKPAAPAANHPPAADPAGAVDWPPPSAENAPSDEVQALLFAQLQYWKGKARKPDSDPGFWVDYVFENDDEPQIKAVLWAVRHYPFAALVQFDPELGSDGRLREWFSALYDGIRGELAARDGDAAAPPAGGDGNASNAGDNAPPDSRGSASADREGSGAADPAAEPAGAAN